MLQIADYAFRLTSLVMLVTAVIAAGVARVAWGRRDVPAAAPLALLQAATCWWSLMAAVETAAPTAAAVQTWGQLGYLGIATAPLFYFLFSVEYTHPGRWLIRRRLAALAVIPVVTLALVATNDWHRWHWSSVTLNPVSGLGVFGRGPWFWVHVAYSYGMILSGLLVLIRAALTFPAPYQRQVGAVLFGSTPPLLANLMYLAFPGPLLGLDWTPIGLAFSGVTLAWALFRAGLLRLAPIARNQLMESMPEAVLVLGRLNQVVDANDAAARLFGRPLIGQASPLPAHIVLSEADRLDGEADAVLPVQRLASPRQDGRQLEAHLSRVRDARRRPLGWLVILRDVTERERAAEALREANERLQVQLAEVQHLQAQLREEIIRDTLTDAFNRRYLQATLPRELAIARREGKPLCLVMLDLDHFKRLNDTFGHAAGDAVLRGLVDLIGSQIRQGDALCRYGGEEFVVIMSNVNVADAARRAEAWRAGFAGQRLSHAGRPLAATISLGVAAFPEHAETSDELLQRADEALYAAKAAGRNRAVVWEPDCGR